MLDLNKLEEILWTAADRDRAIGGRFMRQINLDPVRADIVQYKAELDMSMTLYEQELREAMP